MGLIKWAPRLTFYYGMNFMLAKVQCQSTRQHKFVTCSKPKSELRIEIYFQNNMRSRLIDKSRVDFLFCRKKWHVPRYKNSMCHYKIRTHVILNKKLKIIFFFSPSTTHLQRAPFLSLYLSLGLAGIVEFLATHCLHTLATSIV